MSPTIAAALIVLVGVLLTVGGSFFGAWLHDRREHARWVRQQRLDAYVRLLGILDAMDPAIPSALGDLEQRLPYETAASIILGPTAVREAVGDMGAAADRGDLHAFDAARTRLTAAMRAATGVPED